MNHREREQSEILKKGARQTGLLVRSLLLVGAGALLTGCANTLTAVSLPADSPWSNFSTGFLSPYGDLSAETTGTGITATLQRFESGRMCQGPNHEHLFSTELEQGELVLCPAEYEDLGTFYLYSINVQTTPTFTPGEVRVIASDGGDTALSFALARDGTNTALNITAGFSEGTIPGRPSFSGDDSIQEPSAGLFAYLIDDYTILALSPADPKFENAELPGSDGLPDILCEAAVEGGTDAVLFRTSANNPLSGSLLCGERRINLNTTQAYKSVGACISDARKRFCAKNGLKGTGLAACNAAQIGACQAAFTVPSKLARQLEESPP
jgi:hypothetical protein